jgi:hypothetical protein
MTLGRAVLIVYFMGLAAMVGLIVYDALENRSRPPERRLPLLAYGIWAAVALLWPLVAVVFLYLLLVD